MMTVDAYTESCPGTRDCVPFLCVAAYLIVGTWAGRRVKHLDDYFVAGRQAPTLLILGTCGAAGHWRSPSTLAGASRAGATNRSPAS